MKLPTTVAGVIEEMHTIGAALEPTDGVQVFNAVYLQVTERIDRLLDEGQTFEDGPAAVDLDTRFAGLWLARTTPPTPGVPSPRRGHRCSRAGIAADCSPSSSPLPG